MVLTGAVTTLRRNINVMIKYPETHAHDLNLNITCALSSLVTSCPHGSSSIRFMNFTMDRPGPSSEDTSDATTPAGFWGCRHHRSFFDVRVFNDLADSRGENNGRPSAICQSN